MDFQEFITKNKKSIDKLVNKYSSFNTDEKEDMFQEATITVWEAMEKFNSSKGVKLETFIYTCIENKFKNKLKYDNRAKRKVDEMFSLDYEEEGKLFIETVAEKEQEEFTTDVKENAIKKAFAKSRNKERCITTVKLLEQGYKLKEIADKLGCKYQQLQVIRDKYNKALADQLGVECTNLVDKRKSYYQKYQDNNKEKLKEYNKNYYKSSAIIKVTCI